jgi:hypothetical protein
MIEVLNEEHQRVLAVLFGCVETELSASPAAGRLAISRL